MRISPALLIMLAGLAGLGEAAELPARSCASSGGRGTPVEITQALDRLRPLLSESQRAALEHPLDYDSATGWSNLPVGLVPRTGLRLGDLDAAQAAAARQLFEAALSACGLRLLDEIRLPAPRPAPLSSRPHRRGRRHLYLFAPGAR